MIEAMRRAYLDRARHLGDADFVTIPERLTSKDYAARLAREIDPRHATPSESLAKDISLAKGVGSRFRDESTFFGQTTAFVTKSTPDPVTPIDAVTAMLGQKPGFLEKPGFYNDFCNDFTSQTTHFSIVDASGMAVANTYTLEHSFGSRVVVRGAGFLLNNQMGDFNRKPGHTDRTGRIGTKANLIAPGKRMLSSQSPTIVTRDGKVMLVTGSPGGRTIINTLLCVVVNHVDFGLSPRDCIAAPRLHHQWLPDVVRFEGQDRPEFKDLVAALRDRGHRIEDKRHEQGDTHSIFVEPKTGELIGVADGRRGGAAKGL